MLKDTLVVWGGEFRRTPMSQGGDGRDHHIAGFSIWMAGGGVSGGLPRTICTLYIVHRANGLDVALVSARNHFA